jgi:hypothetical protein
LPIESDIGNLDVDSLTLRIVTAVNSDRNLRQSVWLVVDTRDDTGKTEQHKYMLNFRYYTKFDSIQPEDVIDPLNKPYPYFEPGATNRFTVDTAGRIRLHHITGANLVMGQDPLAAIPDLAGGDKARRRTGTVWRPATVELEVNGQQVRRLQLGGREFTPGEALDLEYPSPAPLARPPLLNVAKIAKVPTFKRTAPRPPSAALAS